MDYCLYVPDTKTRDNFVTAWPGYAELLVDNFDNLIRRHTVIIRDGVTVLSEQFFQDIQDLVQANNYLDALKHDAWMVFGNEFVKLNVGRDYWSLNLRPVLGFDPTTWTIE